MESSYALLSLSFTQNPRNGKKKIRSSRRTRQK